MKMEIKTIKALAPAMFLAAALLLPSCVQDNTADDLQMQSEVGFTTAVSTNDNWNAVTKSGVIPTDIDSVGIEETVTANGEMTVDTKGFRVDSIGAYGSFGTFAYVYSSSSNWASEKSSLTPNYMYNLKSEKIDNEWRPNDKLYYWPAASYKLSFFGYAPYNDYTVNGVSVSDYMKISGATATGAPVITYTVPTDIKSQIDLMTADSLDVPGAFHKPVPMTFRHNLAGVRFNAKTYGNVITIKSVKMTGLYNNGTYAIGDASWTLGTTKSDFEFTTTHAVNGTSSVINDADDSLFFMMPQTLPAGAQLVVTYIYNGVQRTATADFSGKTWEMGKIYVYNLTVEAASVYYEFTVTLAENNLEENKATYNVISRKVTDNGSGVPTYENVDYDVTNLPTGATYEKQSDGSVLVVFGPSRSGAQRLVTSNTALALRSLDSLAGPIDLTTGNNYTSGTRGETANCYVYNRAGYYCFPCDVMGNGNSGIISTENYYTESARRTNGFFVDYNGNLLNSSAALSVSSGDKAVLLWEDQKGMINNLQLNHVGSGYISFTSQAKNSMTPGNAVIALETSAGVIKWSWHIWCTVAPDDYTFKSEVTGRDTTMTLPGVKIAGDSGIPFATERYQYSGVNQRTSSSYTTKIMMVNLGTVERNRYFTFYPARVFGFTVTQQVTGNSSNYSVDQAEVAVGEAPIGYTNTLYQWGRKDPFVSGDISTASQNTTSKYYNASNVNGVNTFSSSVSSNNERNGIFGIYATKDNDQCSLSGSGGVYSWNISSYSTNLIFAINHPMTMVVNTYSGSDQSYTNASWFSFNNDIFSSYYTDKNSTRPIVSERYDNPRLWGGGYSWHYYQTSTTKTIYDPCPAGYKVPVALCYDGHLVGSGVYKYGNVTTNGLFFPATGVRNSKTGVLQQMGVRGDFWAGSMKYTLPGVDNGCFVKNAEGEFGHVNYDADMSRANAMSIRPVGSDY